MKKLLFIAAVLFTLAANAQDYIIRTSRDTLKCTIVSATEFKIEYRLPGLPVYQIEMSSVLAYKRGNEPEVHTKYYSLAKEIAANPVVMNSNISAGKLLRRAAGRLLGGVIVTTIGAALAGIIAANGEPDVAAGVGGAICVAGVITSISGITDIGKAGDKLDATK